MRKLREFAFAAFVLCAWAILAPVAQAQQMIRDVVYGQAYFGLTPSGPYELRDLLLDAYLPEKAADGLRPAVVMVHGGSFMEGGKGDRKLIEIARHLCEHGYACFSIDYRLIRDFPPAAPPFDATMLQAALHAAYVDAKTAIRFVRAHAAEYGLDADRIAVLGESAGAFAALAAGVSDPEAFTADRADLPVPEMNNPGASGKPNAVVELWGSAEPVLDLFDAADPPIMVAHGSEDIHLSVPFGLARKIKDTCDAKGIPCRFYPIAGEDHGAWNGNYEGKSLKALILEFLDEFLDRERAALTARTAPSPPQ